MLITLVGQGRTHAVTIGVVETQDLRARCW
jgi:hypothetical protein